MYNNMNLSLGLGLALLVALSTITHVQCKCSVTQIAEDDRTVAFSCVHGSLDDLEEVSNEAQWIEFSVSHLRTIPARAFARFPRLRRLAIYNSHVHSIDPLAFDGLDHLEWLVIHGAKLGVARAAWFKPLKNLRNLALHSCDLLYVEPEVFELLPNLEMLGMRDNDLDCLPIERIASLTRLKVVRISQNPWQCGCRQRLDTLFRERYVKQEMEECMIPNEPEVPKQHLCMADFQTGRVQTNYRVKGETHQIVQNYQLASRSFNATHFAEIDKLPDETRWIHIADIIIYQIPRYAFFRFGNSLTKLEIINCNLATIERDAFVGLHKLETLTLINNRLDVVRNYWFRDLLNLQVLNLENNKIKHIESKALSHVGNTLRYLNIRGNELECFSTADLEDLRRLQRIEPGHNPWICKCWRDIEGNFNRRHINYDVNFGNCKDIDVVQVERNWTVQAPSHAILIGAMRWGTIKEERNGDFVGHQVPELPQPSPIRRGSCRPLETVVHSFTCAGDYTLTGLNELPVMTTEIEIKISNLRVITNRAFSRFRHLKRLTLTNCGVETIERDAFAGLTSLETLTITGNNIYAVTRDWFQDLRNLKYLNLPNNHIKSIPNDLFDDLPNLIGLDVSSNDLNCINADLMRQKLPYLRILAVNDNPWTCLCGTKLVELLMSCHIYYDIGSVFARTENGWECARGRFRVTQFIPPQVVPPPPTEPPISPMDPDRIKGSCTRVEEPGGPRFTCTGGNLALFNSIAEQARAIEFNDGELPHLPARSLRRFTNLHELIINNCGLKTIEAYSFKYQTNLERLSIINNPLGMVSANWTLPRSLEWLDLSGDSLSLIEPNSIGLLDKLKHLSLTNNKLQSIYTSELTNLRSLEYILYNVNHLKWRSCVEIKEFLDSRNIKYTAPNNGHCDGKLHVKPIIFGPFYDKLTNAAPETTVSAIAGVIAIIILLTA